MCHLNNENFKKNISLNKKTYFLTLNLFIICLILGKEKKNPYLNAQDIGTANTLGSQTTKDNTFGPHQTVVKTFSNKSPFLVSPQNSSSNFNFDAKLPSNDSASILNQSSTVNFK